MRKICLGYDGFKCDEDISDRHAKTERCHDRSSRRAAVKAYEYQVKHRARNGTSKKPKKIDDRSGYS